MNIRKIIEKAQYSSFYMRILNFGMNRNVPFNKPHGFKVIELSENHLAAFAPYKKSNFNHIKGIHACALATLSEFTTGFLLMTRLDPKKYRLILQHLSMEYHYQAKMDIYSMFKISEEWLKENIYEPLESSDSVSVACDVKIHDKAENHISTGKIIWQIKSWEKVKTKV